MADDFGRVNPVSPHFLDRGSRKEPYAGRHGRKHQEHGQGDTKEDAGDEREVAAPASGIHINLRI